MRKRSSAFARILAAIALVAAVVAIVIAVSSALDSHSDDGSKHSGKAAQQEQPRKPRTKAKTYTVKSGDTLISISHKTGIPVAELLALNPEVDPQILIAGESLKLK
jgi:LysM repeat protein